MVSWRGVAIGGALAALVLAVACAGAKPSLVSPGGRLRIVNATGEPLEVFARGDRVAHLADAEDVHLDRMPLGDCPVEARGERTGWRMGTTLHLDESAEATWTVRGSDDHAKALKDLPTGSVRFVNASPEPVRAFVDDGARDLVWPGGEAEYSGLVPGPHHVRAEGAKTSFRTEADLDVAAGTVAMFRVVPPTAALRVTNRSGSPARVAIRDEPERLLKAGAAATFDNLDAGATDVSARDDQGRFLWAGTATLVPGQVTDVVIPAPEGVISVLSDLKVPVSIWVDGTNLGLCGASGAAEFRGLAVGRVHVSALDPEGRTVAKASLVLARGNTTLWMVREGETSERRGDEGSLAVENGTPEPLRVQVDGYDRGEVKPGARRIVPGLPPGTHRVNVLALRSRDVLRADVAVQPGSVTTWTARPRSAILSLKNLRDEEVRVRIDGEARVRLAPAQSIELALPGGPHVIDSIGVTSLRATSHRMELPASATTRLDLPSPFATLVATNRRGEPLTLLDGDRQLGVVLPGDRVTLRDIDPGDHLLEARALDRPLSWHVKVNLAAGDSFAWELGD